MTKKTFRASMRMGTRLDTSVTDRLAAKLDDAGLPVELHAITTRKGERHWRLDFGRASRPEFLIDRVVRLGLETARYIGQVTGGREGDITISIRQEIHDPGDPHQRGILLSRDILHWATLAGASIEIDQYFQFDG